VKKLALMFINIAFNINTVVKSYFNSEALWVC
jgi:hypothetical protein